MVANQHDKPKNRPPVPQRLTADSRLTTKQSAFAHLWANGLNSAAECYRQAYKINSGTGDWWCRSSAYNLIRKPHVQALVSRLKAEYDAARPALSRSTKREILRDMAIADTLDAVDRQRAIDLDNKMQSEYSERMHLTGDVNITMFRAQAPGAIPWQLAEQVIELEPKPVQEVKALPLDAPQLHVKASSSEVVPSPCPGMDPPEKLAVSTLPVDVPSNPKPPKKGKTYRKPLTPAQIKILGKTYANRRRKTIDS